MFEEKPGDVEVSVVDRSIERATVRRITFLRNIRISASLKEQSHHFQVPAAGRVSERRTRTISA